MRIRNFGLNEVELTEPVLKNAFDKERDYLYELEADRLLARFRETAGLEKKAECYIGGWENGEIAGHTLGHYMAALSQIYEANGDQEVKERLTYIMRELSDCQSETGYLFTTGEEIFDRIESGGLAWMPWYTMHRILTGILCVYQSVQLSRALDVAVKLGDWIYNRVTGWDDLTKRRTLCIEYDGIAGSLYELCRVTGDMKYAEAAKAFDEPEVYEKLAQGADVLNSKNASSATSKMLGVLKRYLVTEEAVYLKAAENFFTMYVEKHAYITGGSGEWGHFRESGKLGQIRSQCNCENCTSHNMMKLAEQLYCLTGKKKYMEYCERLLLNAILGAQNPETGMTAYYQPMAPGFFKAFANPFSRFWCCVGSGMESFTRLNSSIYHTDGASVYVNQYIASVLKSEALGLQIVQKVDFDCFEKALFTIESADGEVCSICFRSPDWSGETKVLVNGTPAEEPEENGYFRISRSWKAGDTVEVCFLPEIRSHVLQDTTSAIAVSYGPFVLAAGLGNEEMTVGKTDMNVAVSTLNVPVRKHLIVLEGTVEDWVEDINNHFARQEGELAFRTIGTDADEELSFIPYYKHYADRYGTYFDYYTPEELPEGVGKEWGEARLAEEAKIAAEKAAEEERLRKEEEERLAAEKAAEEARIAAEKAAEEERLRKEEEERLAAEKAAEEARIAAEKAAEEERLRKEEEERLAAKDVADAIHAAEVAEAKAREEEASLQAIRFAAERAEAEAMLKKAEAEALTAAQAVEAAKTAKARELMKQDKAKKSSQKAKRKSLRKRSNKLYRRSKVPFVIGFFVVIVLLVLCYIFALPVTKGFYQAKNIVDEFLLEQFPKVASGIGIREDDLDEPIFKDAETTVFLVEDAERYVSAVQWPAGYNASVEKLNGREYICVTGNGLKICYLNELAEQNTKHIYIKSGKLETVLFRDYDFAKPQLLCPESIVLTAGLEKQYVFLSEGKDVNPLILSANTLEECRVMPFEDSLRQFITIEKVTQQEEETLLHLKAKDASYVFSLPKKNAESVEAVTVSEKLTYRFTREGLYFTTEVLAGNAYLGRIQGTMSYKYQIYTLSDLTFYVYANEIPKEKSPVYPAVTQTEAFVEREIAEGKKGELLLIPVRTEKE